MRTRQKHLFTNINPKKIYTNITKEKFALQHAGASLHGSVLQDNSLKHFYDTDLKTSPKNENVLEMTTRHLTYKDSSLNFPMTHLTYFPVRTAIIK